MNVFRSAPYRSIQRTLQYTDAGRPHLAPRSQHSRVQYCRKVHLKSASGEPYIFDSDNSDNSERTTQRNENGPSIGIIGAGNVGSAIASSIINKNIANNIIMSDVNKLLCEGVVLDLQDEAYINGTIVEYKPLNKMRNCDVIVITAGARQLPDEPRTNLIKKNAHILKSILEDLFPLHPNTIIVVVSNPVDILTALVQKWSEKYIPKNQVIGTGTYLDTQRLRVLLSQKFKVSVKSIHAYVLGEHGDSQVVARSISTIGGCKLEDYYNFSDSDFSEIEKQVRTKAYEIIKRKGATYHGIGACVSTIIESILLNKNEIFPISVYQPSYKSYIGWPTVIGKSGVVSMIPVHVSSHEHEKLQKSADLIKKICEDIDKSK